MDKIYDESGLIIGEASPIGEVRPEVEKQDMYFCDGCDCFHNVDEVCTMPNFETPDILDDDILPTSGIKVEEHQDIISRNYFVLEYLLVKEKSNVHIRQCW